LTNSLQFSFLPSFQALVLCIAKVEVLSITVKLMVVIQLTIVAAQLLPLATASSSHQVPLTP
jgi:hypothetical protein